MCIIIPFSKINWQKATDCGLRWAMELVLENEQYEYAAIIRNEMDRRKLNNPK
jgi:protein-arginine kinase activator protein McsA